MILYTIKRKADGRYFIHTDGKGALCMSRDPVFFKKAETIARNLKRICSEFKRVQKNPDFKWFYEKHWINFDRSLLLYWEVEVFELQLQDRKIVPADTFINTSDIDMNNLETAIT